MAHLLVTLPQLAHQLEPQHLHLGLGVGQQAGRSLVQDHLEENIILDDENISDDENIQDDESISEYENISDEANISDFKKEGKYYFSISI